MPGTHYVLRGDEYDLRVQDASDLTTGRAFLQRVKHRQRPQQRGFGPTPRMPRRMQAARKAYIHRIPQRLDRGINRALWKVQKKLTPATLTGKLAGAAALGGAAAAAPLAFLGTALMQALLKNNKPDTKKYKSSGLNEGGRKKRERESTMPTLQRRVGRRRQR